MLDEWVDESAKYDPASEAWAALEATIAAQAARIAELEWQLQDKQDKPDYRTLIRFPTEP